VINGFLSTYDNCDSFTASATSQLPKAGWVHWLCGISRMSNSQTNGGVGFYNLAGSIHYDTCSVASNSSTGYGFVMAGDNAYSCSVYTNCAIDAEASAPSMRYAMATVTYSIGQLCIQTNGCSWDTHLTTGRPAIFHSFGGSNADQFVHINAKFYPESTATEVIHVAGGTVADLQLIGCTQPTQAFPWIRWCNVNGAVQVISNNSAFAYADSSGTPGNATISQPMGRFAIASGASAVTITNNLVGAKSIVTVNKESNDATLTSFKVVPASGSFTVTGNANATAATVFSFTV